MPKRREYTGKPVWCDLAALAHFGPWTVFYRDERRTDIRELKRTGLSRSAKILRKSANSIVPNRIGRPLFGARDSDRHVACNCAPLTAKDIRYREERFPVVRRTIVEPVGKHRSRCAQSPRNYHASNARTLRPAAPSCLAFVGDPSRPFVGALAAHLDDYRAIFDRVAQPTDGCDGDWSEG